MSEQPKQNSSPNQDQDRSEEQEALELERQLRELTKQWRAKLADPNVRRQIKSGRLRLSPLVVHLLKTFPPDQNEGASPPT